MFTDPDDMGRQFSLTDMNDMTKRAQLAETPAEIEARLEQRWMAELVRQNDDRQAEITKWRGLVIAAVSRDRRLELSILNGVNLTTKHDFTDEEKVLVDAAMDKMVTYMCMGMDFETIMTAVNSDDTLMSCWEVLMVSMKLGGHDEAID